MKTRNWMIGAAAGLAVLALLVWAFAPRPMEVETAVAARARFEAGIDEDGKTRLRDRYVVSAPIAGLLGRITLREGDPVAAGAVVASVQPALPPMQDQRTLRAQEAGVEGAEAQQERARVRVEAAGVALRRARNDADASEQLARQGFVATSRLDDDRLVVLAAQKDLEAAQQEYRVARYALEQARAALIAVRDGERGARSFALRAPVAGRVLRVLQPDEGSVALGAPLLELGDLSRLEVVVELLTTDALHAAPGSPVRIERWGGDGVLEGRVRAVEPSAFTKVSALGVEEQRVKVLVDITTPLPQSQALGDGFRVMVRIVTLTVDDALVVPVSAVFPLPEGEGMGVFQLLGGRVRLVPVVLGARNGSLAWIRAGLDAGAVVVLYPPAALADGARARERRL